MLAQTKLLGLYSLWLLKDRIILLTLGGLYKSFLGGVEKKDVRSLPSFFNYDGETFVFMWSASGMLVKTKSKRICLSQS